MMKHVQLSPYRSRADSVSLSSTASYSSLSPEPLGSRSSSYSSLSESSAPQTTIKVYAKCLRPDIEYKTLSITFQTTCKEVVTTLLNKYKMRHRDPRLFYLSMEVTVRKAGVRTQLALDEDARPAVLQSCHPRGDSKFSLQTRRGGLVKVYDSALMSNSQYKSLLISARTTSDELIALLLSCYGSSEPIEQFSLYEVSNDREQQRKLHPDDRPLLVQQSWQLPCHFLIRRNPDYRPLSRRKFNWTHDLSTISSGTTSNTSTKQHPHSSTNHLTSLPPIMPKRNDEPEKQKFVESKSQPATPKSSLKQSLIPSLHPLRKPPSMPCSGTSKTKYEFPSSSSMKLVNSTSYSDYENCFYI
ncbi:uncharacterized protein LOC123301630 isoform X2 [Chrysoperla carnea]|uniref:uncharacterized protein LOC123301630 isoform X2 n=1 Tax=Chrysoperla carnea TaxID=189513 RepID=UPI001D07176C|nr:uncharacterized protein LOC123301630 isoform X2 [Chrysoperla carnea]